MEKCPLCNQISVYTDLFKQTKKCLNRDCGWKETKNENEGLEDIPDNIRQKFKCYERDTLFNRKRNKCCPDTVTC